MKKFGCIKDLYMLNTNDLIFEKNNPDYFELRKNK